MKAVATIIWIILGATLAGIGLTIVVATPQLADQSMKYIPWAALAGFVIAIPFSILLASKLRGRVPGA
jgi:flagellar biosynthesis protein FliQ